jgi:uncharacterized membrane protein YkoI
VFSIAIVTGKKTGRKEMTKKTKYNLSWVFVAVSLIAGMGIYAGAVPAVVASDHENVREMKLRGDIVGLSELIDKVEAQGMKVLEAEFEHENGKLVYELEVLDKDGWIYEHYYDAVTGELLGKERED